MAPTSLQVNWRNEARKFAPNLKVRIYKEGDRDLNNNELRLWGRGSRFIRPSYERGAKIF